MKTRFVLPTLLLATLAGFANVAQASNEAAGVFIGAGSGAIIGHAISGGEGAVFGGILGAMVGAAIADDDHGRPVAVRRDYRPAYGPRPVVVYEAPRVRYVSTPVIVYNRPAPYVWRHDERRDYRDGRWDNNRRGNHDRWNDGRDGRDGRRGW